MFFIAFDGATLCNYNVIVKANIVTRIAFNFKEKENYIALDQIRAVDQIRLSKKISVLNQETAQVVCERLQELFAY